MAVGDMKYAFTDLDGLQQEVEIPAAVLRSGKHRGLNNKQSIMDYLYKQGYAVAKPDIPDTPKKVRARKIDEKKQKLLDTISKSIETLGSVISMNSDRMVQIEIDNELYEITIVKKRKPKT